jgi:hypothetical protein
MGLVARDASRSLGSADRMGVVLVAVGLAAGGPRPFHGRAPHRVFRARVGCRGDGIYYVERDSFGIVWGFGWEMFTPPAYSYVMNDEFRLRHLAIGGAEPATLASWSTSPVEGRVTRHTGGGSSTRFRPASTSRRTACPIWIKMSIPRVPTSEQWAIEGTWSRRRAPAAHGARIGPAHARLRTRPGRRRRAADGAGAGILSGGHPGGERRGRRGGSGAQRRLSRALSRTGCRPDKIAERSRREQIEHMREFRRVQSELEARYQGRGAQRRARRPCRPTGTWRTWGFCPSGRGWSPRRSTRLPATARFRDPAQLLRRGAVPGHRRGDRLARRAGRYRHRHLSQIL